MKYKISLAAFAKMCARDHEIKRRKVYLATLPLDIIRRSMDDFLQTKDWLDLQQVFLDSVSNQRCSKCKSSKNLIVGHVKPRKWFPELALEIANLQLLCRRCSKGSGDKHKWV